MNPDLLSQLRDIHAAPAVPWWPPAPGWWLLALLLLVLLAWLGRLLLAHYRVHQRRKQMLGWVDNLNVLIDPENEPQAYLSTLNRIIKLVALKAFPGQHCAAMAGTEWVGFLNGNIKGDQFVDSLAVLATGPFEPQPKFDPDTVCDLTRLWIRQHG